MGKIIRREFADHRADFYFTKIQPGFLLYQLLGVFWIGPCRFGSGGSGAPGPTINSLIMWLRLKVRPLHISHRIHDWMAWPRSHLSDMVETYSMCLRGLVDLLTQTSWLFLRPELKGTGRQPLLVMIQTSGTASLKVWGALNLLFNIALSWSVFSFYIMTVLFCLIQAL